MDTTPHPPADQRVDALAKDRGQTGHTPPVTTKRIYHAVGSSFTYTICPSGDTHTQVHADEPAPDQRADAPVRAEGLGSTDAPAAHTTAAAARAQDAGVPLGSTDALAPLFDAATIRAQHTAGVSIGDMVQFIREVRPTCTFIQAFAEVRAGLDTTRSSVSLLPPLFVARPMADASASATSNSASPPPSYTPTYALAVMRRAQLAPTPLVSALVAAWAAGQTQRYLVTLALAQVPRGPAQLRLSKIAVVRAILPHVFTAQSPPVAYTMIAYLLANHSAWDAPPSLRAFVMHLYGTSARPTTVTLHALRVTILALCAADTAAVVS